MASVRRAWDAISAGICFNLAIPAAVGAEPHRRAARDDTRLRLGTVSQRQGAGNPAAGGSADSYLAVGIVLAGDDARRLPGP